MHGFRSGARGISQESKNSEELDNKFWISWLFYLWKNLIYGMQCAFQAASHIKITRPRAEPAAKSPNKLSPSNFAPNLSPRKKKKRPKIMPKVCCVVPWFVCAFYVPCVSCDLCSQSSQSTFCLCIIVSTFSSHLFNKSTFTSKNYYNGVTITVTVTVTVNFILFTDNPSPTLPRSAHGTFI